MNRRTLALPGIPILGAGVLLAAALIFSIPHVAFPQGAGGPSWEPAGLPGQTIHSIVIGHTHPGLVFAGTEQGVYRRDGGVWHRVLRAPAVWNLSLLPNDSEIIAGDNDGYVHVSRDRGAHWAQSLVNPQGVYAVTSVPGHPNTVIAGAAEGLYLSRDGGRHWSRRLPLHESAVAAFAWLPGSSRVLFAGMVAGGPAGETRVFVSRDAGMSWRLFGRGLGPAGGIMSLETARPRLYAGTMGHAVWAVPLRGGTWRQVAGGMPRANDHGAGLARIPGRHVSLYVGTLGQGVYRTSNGGRTWRNISTGLPQSNGLAIVLSLADSPHRHILYAGTTDGVYALHQP